MGIRQGSGDSPGVRGPYRVTISQNGLAQNAFPPLRLDRSNLESGMGQIRARKSYIEPNRFWGSAFPPLRLERGEGGFSMDPVASIFPITRNRAPRFLWYHTAEPMLPIVKEPALRRGRSSHRCNQRRSPGPNAQRPATTRHTSRSHQGGPAGGACGCGKLPTLFCVKFPQISAFFATKMCGKMPQKSVAK